MARGEHRARAVQQPGGEVELIGGRQTDAHHVEALAGDAGGEGGGQGGRTVAHVVADHDLAGALGAHQSGEGCAQIGDQRLVELFAD